MLIRSPNGAKKRANVSQLATDFWEREVVIVSLSSDKSRAITPIRPRTMVVITPNGGNKCGNVSQVGDGA